MTDTAWVCWLDLETTGPNETHDPILEVGAVLCRNEPGMPVEYQWSWLARQPDDFWTVVHPALDPYVRDMHDTNGLWRALGTNAEQDLAEIDDNFSSLLRQICGGNHVALAGSGVSHFDRRFIHAQMPRTDKRFTYWAYDVGVVRRLFDRTNPDLVRPLPAQGKAHRGLDDALDHRDEWLHYEALLTQNGAAA